MESIIQHTSKPIKLAPSKCTVYISNLPYTLTNTDLHKIFEKFGQIIKVTVLCDKESRKSKGVAFILFHHQDSAHACVKATNRCQMFGRTLRSNIAKDNGRAPEFIRRREYPDKSRCYECGDFGHLSYACPKNVLGAREPPKKKKKIKKSFGPKMEKQFSGENEDDDIEYDFEDDSLSAAIRMEQELHETEKRAYGESSKVLKTSHLHKIKQSSYFSDEEELSD